jgi:hypothetical protein
MVAKSFNFNLPSIQVLPITPLSDLWVDFNVLVRGFKVMVGKCCNFNLEKKQCYK